MERRGPIKGWVMRIETMGLGPLMIMSKTRQAQFQSALSLPLVRLYDHFKIHFVVVRSISAVVKVVGTLTRSQ